METNFIEQISDIGNNTNPMRRSYYEELGSEIKLHHDNFSDDDIHELICRLESFIEQEIEDIQNDYDYQLNRY